jgi:hypothetical protein
VGRMKLLDRPTARRRRKAHERYLLERERQKELASQDTQDAIQNAARGWGVGGQATSGGN